MKDERNRAELPLRGEAGAAPRVPDRRRRRAPVKPPPFTYHRPGTLGDALALLRTHGDEGFALFAAPQAAYTRELLALGEADVAARRGEVLAFFRWGLRP